MSRWERLAMTVVVTAALIVGAFTVLGSAEPASRTVTVLPGDTLTSLVARELPGMNSVRAVEAIESLNGLADGSIYAGESLRLPAPR